jgi:hypothetical protein
MSRTLPQDRPYGSPSRAGRRHPARSGSDPRLAAGVVRCGPRPPADPGGVGLRQRRHTGRTDPHPARAQRPARRSQDLPIDAARTTASRGQHDPPSGGQSSPAGGYRHWRWRRPTPPPASRRSRTPGDAIIGRANGRSRCWAFGAGAESQAPLPHWAFCALQTRIAKRTNLPSRPTWASAVVALAAVWCCRFTVIDGRLLCERV